MNRKAVSRVLRAGVSLGLLLCSAGRIIAQTSSQSPESLFAIARAYYGPDQARGKLPPDAPSGLTCLLNAAESNYPPALFNLYLAYGLGYLGQKDFQQAASYRERWLEALGTPSAYVELALSYLGAWNQIPDPKEKDFNLPDFIFTGTAAKNNRGQIEVRQSAFAPRAYAGTTNLTNAVRYFTQAALVGFDSWSSLSKQDQAASQKAIAAMSSLVLGERVQFEHTFRPPGWSLQTQLVELHSQMFPPNPAALAKLFLQAPAKGIALPPNAMRAAARLIKRISPEEFVSFVVEPSSPVAAP